jgi:chemotaxis protein MotB
MVRSVVVEGHTDETGTDAWNVQLSQNRATQVAEQTLQLLSHDSKNYRCFLSMMSASGRGDNDLVRIGGQIDEDKSRRVEFHLRVPSFEQRNAAPRDLEMKIQHVTGSNARIELQHE